MTLEQVIIDIESAKRALEDYALDVLGIEETDVNMRKLAQAKDDLDYAIDELKGVK